eukprot:2859708-Rhodomonas_salina.1
MGALAGYHVARNSSLLSWHDKSSPAAGTAPPPGAENAVVEFGDNLYVISPSFAYFSSYNPSTESWQDLKAQSSGSAPASVAWMSMVSYQNESVFVANQSGGLHRYTAKTKIWSVESAGGPSSPAGM